MRIVEIAGLNAAKELIERTLDSSFQGVVGGDRDILQIFIESHADTFEKLRICPERIFAFSFGINVPASHFFFEPYNDYINYYIAAGFAEKSMRRHYRDMNMEISKEDKEPEVLTMEHLGAGFVICFIPAMFAVIAFIGEFIHACKIKRQQAKVARKKRLERIQKFKVKLDTKGI